jgi:hypothetical protein
LPVDRELPDPESYPKNWFAMDLNDALDHAESVIREIELEEPFIVSVAGDHFPIFGVGVYWGDDEFDGHGVKVDPLTKAGIRNALIEAKVFRVAASIGRDEF